MNYYSTQLIIVKNFFSNTLLPKITYTCDSVVVVSWIGCDESWNLLNAFV